MTESYVGLLGAVIIFVVFYFGFKKTPEQRSLEERNRK
jgi:hypothetical protein